MIFSDQYGNPRWSGVHEQDIRTDPDWIRERDERLEREIREQGQAHHMFSRFPNLRIFFTKFSILLFSYKVKNERIRSSWPQDGTILADFWGFWIFSNAPSCGQDDLVLLMSKIFQIATKKL